MAAPYDTLEVVVTAARVRLNDSIASAGGEILTDSAVFAIQTINSAWRRLQEFLAESNAARLVNEAIILGLPVNLSADPGGNAQLNWSGYAPKGAVNPAFVLPADMIFPLRLWERVNGSALPFTDMEYVVDGMQNQPAQARNYNWEWREDSIFMPGSTVVMDLKIRYAAFLPDFLPNGTGPGQALFSTQTVPIIRSLDAFAWYIASEMANARGDLDGTSLDAKAEAAAKKLADRDTRVAALRSQWVIPDIPPAAGNTHYDSVSTMLNTVKTRMNALAKSAGDVVTSSQPFTQQCVNTGWRRMQEHLIGLGFSRLVNETILVGLPVNVSSDPGGNAQLSWAGYYPKSPTVNMAFKLPEDMVRPLRLWERVSGSSALFTPMEYVVDGMANQPNQARNYQWEWRDDSIFMPGSSVRMDLKIRYACYLSDFVSTTVPWYLQTIPLARALDALAYYTCVEIASARPDIFGDDRVKAVDSIKSLQEAGESACGLLASKDKQAADLRGQWTIPDIPPAAGNTPYDSVSTVLNAVRVRMNAVSKLAGDVLTSSQSFTQQAFNTAWRRMQEKLIALDFSRLTGLEVQLTALSATTNNDPGSQVSLTWSGYDFGGGFSTTQALPAGLIRPMRVWERVSGSSAQFVPMEYTLNGLPTQPKQGRNYSWEWSADSLNMPGSTKVMDLRIRYTGYLPDFVNTSTTPWYAQTVPISRALDALAWYTCFEVASARPDLGLTPEALMGLQSQAMAACESLAEKDKNAQDQRGEWTIPDIPEAPGNTPYDSAATVLNVARARLNRVSTVAGDIISPGNPFTQQYFNTAWRRFQEFVANFGVIRLVDETVLTALPVVGSIDPSSQVSLSWSGYFDGANWQSSPILPTDLMFPLKLWERQSGSNNVFSDPPMENMLDGLCNRPKMTCNGQWEWRADAIYLPGATFPMDLRVRYAKYLPDFSQAGSTPWYQQGVPIARCSDALSLYICAEVGRARPDLGLDPLELKAEAEETARLVFNRDVRAKQRVNVRRLSRSGRLEGGGSGDYALVY